LGNFAAQIPHIRQGLSSEQFCASASAGETSPSWPVGHDDAEALVHPPIVDTMPNCFTISQSNASPR
jgi:hypothetical protein